MWVPCWNLREGFGHHQAGWDGPELPQMGCWDGPWRPPQMGCWADLSPQVGCLGDSRAPQMGCWDGLRGPPDGVAGADSRAPQMGCWASFLQGLTCLLAPVSSRALWPKQLFILMLTTVSETTVSFKPLFFHSYHFYLSLSSAQKQPFGDVSPLLKGQEMFSVYSVPLG